MTSCWADLREPLALPRTADAAISVATLHWLPDHQLVFTGVANALRPGGRFVAEAGGPGNIASVQAVLDELGADDSAGTAQFAGAAETRTRLAAAGFAEIDVRAGGRIRATASRASRSRPPGHGDPGQACYASCRRGRRTLFVNEVAARLRRAGHRLRPAPDQRHPAPPVPDHDHQGGAVIWRAAST